MQSHFVSGSKEKAKQFFEQGLEKVFTQVRKTANYGYPFSIYYAFKQTESEAIENGTSSNIASTGWETMLEGLNEGGVFDYRYITNAYRTSQ